MNKVITDPLSILDRVYQNVIVEKIVDGKKISSTYSNRILPAYVTALFSQLHSIAFTPSTTGSFYPGIPFASNIAAAVQYGATGIEFLSASQVTINVVDPYPSLLTYPNSMSMPLLLTTSASIGNVYRSVPSTTNSLQYALIDNYTSITVGSYTYANGIQLQFSLQPFDMDPTSITYGNNANYILKGQNGIYTVFSEVSLILLPQSLVSTTTSFTSTTVAQYPILAHVLFDAPMLKNSNIIYNFYWNIWFNY